MQKLNDIPGKNPFIVPENYFEDINTRILSSTTGEKGMEKNIFSVRFRSYFAVAASIAGFIIISYIALRLFIPSANKQLAQIPVENIELYINDIDITFLENAVIPEMNEKVPETKDDELIEYLLRENIEISEIYELL